MDFALLDIDDAFVTTNTTQLFEKMNKIHVHSTNNSDCPEPALNAIQISLEKVLYKSQVFVFTDDIAKDVWLMNDVKRLIQEKQASISFFITKGCTKRTNPGYNHFKELANISGGQVYFLSEDDITKMLQVIGQNIDPNRDVVHAETFENETQATYVVGENTKVLTISITGLHPEVTFIGPNNQTVLLKPQLDLENVQVYQVSNPKPGPWVIDAKIQDVAGQFEISEVSPLSFKFGFASTTPKNIKETFFRPLKWIKNYLAVAPLNMPAGYTFTHISIDSDKGSSQYALHESEPGLYITQSFFQPDQFKVTIYGKDAKGNQLKRLISTAIQPEIECKSAVFASIIL
jgi:hypothetical protein